MGRKLSFLTDGADVRVEVCEWTPLEIQAGLALVLQSLAAGKFPVPQAPTVSEPSETNNKGE